MGNSIVNTSLPLVLRPQQTRFRLYCVQLIVQTSSDTRQLYRTAAVTVRRVAASAASYGRYGSQHASRAPPGCHGSVAVFGFRSPYCLADDLRRGSAWRKHKCNTSS